MASVLQADGLTKRYGDREVVSGVSLQLEPGTVMGLLGPNGAGKTTAFYMIVGLVFPDRGRIRLKNEDITSLPLHERSRLGIAYLPQESSLFKKLTVFENIALAFEARGFARTDAADRASTLLKRFGLQVVENSVASALSGGERRRCEIARCLAIEPQFVLLDEPFAGIDPIAVNEIRGFIQELKSQNIGVLITDHNVRETLGTCDYGLLMRDGKVFFSGKPEEIAENAEAKKFYLGEDFRLG